MFWTFKNRYFRSLLVMFLLTLSHSLSLSLSLCLCLSLAENNYRQIDGVNPHFRFTLEYTNRFRTLKLWQMKCHSSFESTTRQWKSTNQFFHAQHFYLIWLTEKCWPIVIIMASIALFVFLGAKQSIPFVFIDI